FTASRSAARSSWPPSGGTVTSARKCGRGSRRPWQGTASSSFRRGMAVALEPGGSSRGGDEARLVHTLAIHARAIARHASDSVHLVAPVACTAPPSASAVRITYLPEASVGGALSQLAAVR